MARSIKFITFLMIVMLLTSSLAIAAGVGTTGANYLKIDRGARSAALGSCFVGLANDINALYYNPAGIALMPYAAVDTMQLNWLAGITQQQFSGVVPVKGIGVFGGYYSALNTPSDKETQYDGSNGYYATGKDFDSEIKVYDLAYAMAFNENLSFGIGAKFIEERLADVKKNGMAADAGLLYKGLFMKDLSAGLVVQNFSVTPLRADEPLPQTIVLGLAYDFMIFGDQRLTVLGDMGMAVDGVNTLGVGAEWALNRYIAFRAGYKDKVGLTLGGGLSFGNLNLNYAYVPYGELGNAYRVALGYDFATIEDQEKELEQVPQRELTKEELFTQPEKPAEEVTPVKPAPTATPSTTVAPEKVFEEQPVPEKKPEAVHKTSEQAPKPAPASAAELDGLFEDAK